LLSRGNGDAFTQLYTVHRNKIYTEAIRLTKSPFLAEEIVQEVFLRMWLKRAEMSDIENLEGFLHTVAKNLIFDQLKKIAYSAALGNKLEVVNNNSNLADTDFLLRHHECQVIISEAIGKLHPQQKMVYQLVKKDGLSHEAAAQELGLSRLTVKKHMANSLKFLRGYLTQRLLS